MFHVAQGRWENVERLTILHRAYLIPGLFILTTDSITKDPIQYSPK